MALNPQQIFNALEDIGESIPQSLDDALFSAAQIVIDEIKSDPNFPVDSGALRDSLRARIIDGQFLGISMLNYGYFQNFGVQGTSNEKTQYGVDEVTKTFLPPRNGDKYSFDSSKQLIGGDLPFGVRKSIHKKGLNGQQFFDTAQMIDRIVEITNQNFEL